MKLNTILLVGATALNTVVSIYIYISSAAEIKDDIRIYGKSSSHGGVVEMYRALHKFEPSEFCLNETYQMSTDCENPPPYSVIEIISFESPTDRARNIKISTPGYNLSVRS